MHRFYPILVFVFAVVLGCSGECPASDDHGHMILFQTGHTPNYPDSDVSTSHAGLSQFLLCDGSVHTVSETVDPQVYQELGTMNAAENIAAVN